MECGKLPSRLLARLLRAQTPQDPAVILGPSIGVDAAALALPHDTVLVAGADPITIASQRIGVFAVHVNANDVACMGATPRFFLPTILLPPGSTEQEAQAVFEDLQATARDLGIDIVGGHTEVTAAVNQTVIAGTMLGTCSSQDLVVPTACAVGDHLLLVSRFAIEGTAALAATGRLPPHLNHCADWITDPGISVVGAVQCVIAAVKPKALHDPTEGGVATAIEELAVASGLGIALDSDAIESMLAPETKEACSFLHLDPLGLLASGSLLVVVDATSTSRLLSHLHAHNWEAAHIGSFTSGAVLLSGNPLPRFLRDEALR